MLCCSRGRRCTHAQCTRHALHAGQPREAPACEHQVQRQCVSAASLTGQAAARICRNQRLGPRRLHFYQTQEHPEVCTHLDTGVLRLSAVACKLCCCRTSQDIVTSINWHLAFFDEAHKLKNQKAKLYEAALRMGTKLRYGLTGTAMQVCQHNTRPSTPARLGADAGCKQKWFCRAAVDCTCSAGDLRSLNCDIVCLTDHISVLSDRVLSSRLLD